MATVEQLVWNTESVRTEEVDADLVNQVPESLNQVIVHLLTHTLEYTTSWLNITLQENNPH